MRKSTPNLTFCLKKVKKQKITPKTKIKMIEINLKSTIKNFLQKLLLNQLKLFVSKIQFCKFKTQIIIFELKVAKIIKAQNIKMQKNKGLALSNSLQNLLFPPGKYTSSQLLNLTPYFTSGIKFTLEKFKELMRQIFDSEDQKIWWVVKAEYGEVQAKVLLIVLMLQLFGRQKRDIGGYNQGIKNHPTAKENNLTSPRSKTTRALYMSNEQTAIMHYIKENLMTFLRLLSNEPNAQDPYLEADDLQPLNVLFKVQRNKRFASYLAIYNKSLKLKASAVADHLSPRILISEQQIVSLQGLNYVVNVKEEIACRGKDMRIIGCQFSQIFIDSPVRSLYVVNCNNCTIHIAACQKIAFVDKCEKIYFTTATNLLRICNTVDSSIYYYGPSPIILTGDNRSILIGPNNCPSKELRGHIKSAGIELKDKYFSKFEEVLNKNMQSSNNNFLKMEPKDFDLLVMPIKTQEDQLPKAKNSSTQQENIVENILAPIEYIKQLEDRNKYYQNLKVSIAKSGLSSEMERNLHSALQGNFKEWLNYKGYTKNLNDLVKMLDKK